MTNGTPGTRETPQTLSGGSALDAAIEAAIAATYSRSWGDFPYDDAEAAVRAAEPILRKSLIAERDDLRRRLAAVRALVAGDPIDARRAYAEIRRVLDGEA